MKLTLMQLTVTNESLLLYRAELRARGQDSTRATKMTLAHVEEALKVVQAEIEKEAGLQSWN